VFQSVREEREQLFLIGADGTGLRQLTTAAANHGHPKWAPDGRTLIFNANPGADSNNEEIFEMDRDGSNVRQLTTHPLWDTYASISPDGGSIVFRRVVASAGIDAGLRMIERNSEVFVARRDGSAAANITQSAAFDGWPAWSPDSRSVAFSSNRSGDFHIYVAGRDGADVRRISAGAGSFTKPIWSPDGRQMVCTRTLDGDVDIFVIDVVPTA
jgi:TolB protein